MKKIMITALGLCCLFVMNPLTAQEKDSRSPNFPKLDASPMDLAQYRDQDEQVVARVYYSRPKKRNREIFGKLVPYGQVWRTGANEATELNLYQDMKIGDKEVKAGTYTLYTIPQEKDWTVILNKNTHTWGAYEYSDKDDIVRIKVPVRNSSNTIENLSMAFEPLEEENGANLLIGWDKNYVKVPFKRSE